jgi:hypothetical protein
MHGRLPIARTIALASTAAVMILFVSVLSGCAWLGKGMEVSDAYKKANEAKSGAFITSFEVSEPKQGKLRAYSLQISASGAFDSTDAKHPKSRGEATADGDTVSWVEPGNGRFYFTDEDGLTDFVKIPAGDRPAGKQNGDSILDAVARAVVNFRDAPPVTNATGQPIPAIAADISRAKLCGVSLRAAARTINNSSLNDDTDFRLHISKRDQRAGTSWCSHQMPTPPQLTFGIDNGVLTDYALAGTVRDEKRVASITWKLQLFGLNQPQVGFVPPKLSAKSKRRELRASASNGGARVNELIDSLPDF